VKKKGWDGGFGMIEVLLIFAAFFTALVMIISLGTDTRSRAITDDLTVIKNHQNAILAAVVNGNAWAFTLARNGVVLPTSATNPLTTPLADPPLIAPPLSLAEPFATGAAAFDLYDSGGTLLFGTRSAPTVGFTQRGARCPAGSPFSSTSSTPSCPLNYELRWWVAVNAVNPVVTISATLRVSPSLLLLNPARFSFDNTVVAPQVGVNTISRHLYPSWVSHGLVGTSNPSLTHLDLGSVPACPADFLPGNFCGFNGFSGTIGQSCICSSSICKNGQELFRCQ